MLLINPFPGNNTISAGVTITGSGPAPARTGASTAGNHTYFQITTRDRCAPLPARGVTGVTAGPAQRPALVFFIVIRR